MDVLIIYFGCIDPFLGFCFKKLLEVPIYVLVCGDSFNCSVIEFVGRNQLLGFDESSLLFFVFKIGHKCSTEVLCNIFSIAFF